MHVYNFKLVGTCLLHPTCKCYRYYYNKVTKESRWIMPEELKVFHCSNPFAPPNYASSFYNLSLFYNFLIIHLCKYFFKLARELVEKAPVKEMQQEMLVNHHATVTVSPPVAEADTLVNAAQVASSPVSVAPVIATGDGDVQTTAASRSSTSPVVASPVIENPNGVHTPVVVPSSAVSSAEAAVTINDTVAEPMYCHLTGFRCFHLQLQVVCLVCILKI